MIDNEGIDTIVLGGSTKDDTITLTGWDSPLSTSLSTDYSYSATLGTPSSIAACGTSAAGGGGAGSLSTTITGGGGGGSLMWGGTVTSASPSIYTNQTTGWTTYNNQPSIMKVECDAEFKGEVTIRGVKLDERLNAIEERLGILRPNNDLEGKWEKLKALGEEYRKLEQEILEGENIWDILKK
jgi:hypothetical protein